MASDLSQVLKAEFGLPEINFLKKDSPETNAVKEAATGALSVLLTGVEQDEVQHLVDGLNADMFAALSKAVAARSQRETAQ